MRFPTADDRSRRKSPYTKKRFRLIVEQLEDRAVPAAAYGYTPSQMLHAYGFDKLPYDGAGQTIAIVDAYDNPNIAADLTAFDKYYGLAAANLVKATPQGKPAVNNDWGFEIALDVEWAHVIAPAAKILLVEAKSEGFNDLLGAVSYAVGQGASVVSMSWGSDEFAGETGASYDGKFANLLKTNPNVTFVASSGDSGTTSWPAVSPYVLGVGGTSLQLDAAGNVKSESSWGNGKRSRNAGGSGGGTSIYESKPSYQNDLVTGTKRKSPDVGYDADPSTGVSVYDISNGGWWEVGGTSAGAPQWAGLIALANQARASAGKTALSSFSQTLPTLYALPAADFHDITVGSNYNGSAGSGFDIVTGRGSPHAELIVAALSGVSTSTTTASTTAGTTTTGGPGVGRRHAIVATAIIILDISVRAPDQNITATSSAQTQQPQVYQGNTPSSATLSLRTIIVAPARYLSMLPDNVEASDGAMPDMDVPLMAPSTELDPKAISEVMREESPVVAYHAAIDFSAPPITSAAKAMEPVAFDEPSNSTERVMNMNAVALVFAGALWMREPVTEKERNRLPLR